MRAMELKVWVDGVQRIVCGVTEVTTCQEVVIALAQAIGRTGRYTLIEKWRETERHLAPHENPVVSLNKWGQYASDVQLVLQRTGPSLSERPTSDGMAGRVPERGLYRQSLPPLAAAGRRTHTHIERLTCTDTDTLSFIRKLDYWLEQSSKRLQEKEQELEQLTKELRQVNLQQFIQQTGTKVTVLPAEPTEEEPGTDGADPGTLKRLGSGRQLPNDLRALQSPHSSSFNPEGIYV
ncbi:ras association domain-containing protein 8-like [Alosa alosa]|uniref:ras association domain-containing protein 8-like n=1 Tax=Alosa alosa TaxID=278164 RepID=UPI0020150405|nr:ras association domain-containing protein 8-like [Alosa alosa]